MSSTPDPSPAASGPPDGAAPDASKPVAAAPQSAADAPAAGASQTSTPTGTPKKPKKPVKPGRWRRRLTVALITLIAVTLIFRILLSMLLPWTVRRVARIYGLDCTFERSDIYLTGGDVGLWHVKVTQLDDGKLVAQTDYCRGDISPLQLLRGRLVVQRLEADGVELTVQRNSDGTIPLLQRLLSKPGTPAAPKQPTPGHWPIDFTPPVGIDTMLLSHLRAHLIDQAVQPAVDERVEMDLRFSDLASTVRKARLTIELLRSDVLDSVIFDAEGTSNSTHLEADFQLSARGLHPSPLAGYLAPFGLHAKAAGLAVRATGTIRTDVLPGKLNAIAGVVKLEDMAVVADGQDALTLNSITIDVGSVRPGSADITRILIAGGTFVASRSESGGVRVAGLEWLPGSIGAEQPSSSAAGPVAPAASAPLAGASAPTPPFVWSVDELKLERLRASFKDRHVNPATEVQFGVDDLTVKGIVGDPSRPNTPVTLLGHCSAPGVTGDITIRGKCSPFAAKMTAELDVAVENVRPDALRPYLDLAGVESDLHDGTFTCRMTADMATSAAQAIVANARLFDVRWADGKELLALDEVQISGLGLADGDIRIDAIDVKGPRTAVRHEASGAWWAAGFRLLPPSAVVKSSPAASAELHAASPAVVPSQGPAQNHSATNHPAPNPPARLPRLDIGKFTWNGVRLRVDDDALSPPTSVSIEEAGIEVTDIHADFDPESKATSRGTVHVSVKAPGLAGSLKMDGTVKQTRAGLAADLTVDGRNLSAIFAAPYLKALNVEPTMRDGTLKAILHVDLARKDDRYQANLKISEVQFADGGEEMFGIDQAYISDVEFRPPANPELDGAYIEIGGILLAKPRGQIVREQNGAIRALGIRLLQKPPEAKKDLFSAAAPRSRETRIALVPSPLYSGERVRVRGGSGEPRNSTDRPSPQPSPLSTGEREQEPESSAGKMSPRRMGMCAEQPVAIAVDTHAADAAAHAASQPSSPAAAGKHDVLVLKKFTISDAALGWTDRSVSPAAQTTARVISGELTGLTWGRPADPAKLTFTLKADGIADDVRIVDGTVSVTDNSGALSLHISASGLRQGMLGSYLPPGTAIELKDGRFEGDLSASAGLLPQGGITTSVALSKINFRDGQDGPALFHLDAAKIGIARLDLPGGVIAIDEISATNAQAAARRSSDGGIHAMGLVLSQPVAATQPSAPAAAAAHPATQPATATAKTTPPPPPVAALTLPPPVSSATSEPLVVKKPKYPLVTLGKLYLNLERFTFADEARAGAAPAVISKLHVSARKIEALGDDPQSRGPIDLELGLTVEKVVDSIKFTAHLKPFAALPTAEFELTGTGVHGEGLLALLPELNQTLLAASPDLRPRIDGSTLIDGQFHVSGNAEVKLDRLDPLDFSLTRGITCDFSVKGLEFQGCKDGPVILGVEEVRSEGVEVRPTKGTVVVRTLEVNKITGAVVFENDGLHVLGVVVKIDPAAPPPATQASVAVKPESHTPVAKPAGVSPGAAKTEAHPPAVAGATQAPRSQSGSPAPSTPRAGSGQAGSGQAAQNFGEIRINKLVVSGIDLTFRDRSVSPELLVPLNQLDIDVRDLSSLAFVEDRRVRFSLLLGAGKVPLPKRMQQGAGAAIKDAGAILGGRKVETETVIEDRELFSQIQSDGVLSLYPRPSGWVKTSISAFDLAALKSEVKRAKEDLNNGVFDMSVDARLPGDGSMIIHSHYTFTDLELQEPPNGPVMRFLHPPPPLDTLDTLLAALRDQDGSIDVPLDIPIKEGHISNLDIIGAALAAFTDIIVKAAVAAPLKLAGTGADIVGAFIPGVGGEKAPKKEEPIVLTFPEGDAALSADAQAQLAALLKRMKENPNIEVTLRHTLGRDDVSREALRANPSLEECRELVNRLGRRKQELLRTRVELSGQARSELASRPPAVAAVTLDHLHSVERDLAATEEALDTVCEMLRPGADRKASGRARRAALELGQARLLAVRADLGSSGLPAILNHVHLTRPQFNPTSGTADGKVEISVTVKKKS